MDPMQLADLYVHNMDVDSALTYKEGFRGGGVLQGILTATLLANLDYTPSSK